MTLYLFTLTLDHVSLVTSALSASILTLPCELVLTVFERQKSWSFWLVLVVESWIADVFDHGAEILSSGWVANVSIDVSN
jgi:hypothetical protein